MKAKNLIFGTLMTLCVASNVAAVTVEIVVISKAIKTVKELTREEEPEKEPTSIIIASEPDDICRRQKKSDKVKKAMSIVREILK